MCGYKSHLKSYSLAQIKVEKRARTRTLFYANGLLYGVFFSPRCASNKLPIREATPLLVLGWKQRKITPRIIVSLEGTYEIYSNKTPSRDECFQVFSFFFFFVLTAFGSTAKKRDKKKKARAPFKTRTSEHRKFNRR